MSRWNGLSSLVWISLWYSPPIIQGVNTSWHSALTVQSHFGIDVACVVPYTFQVCIRVLLNTARSCAMNLCFDVTAPVTMVMLYLFDVVYLRITRGSCSRQELSPSDRNCVKNNCHLATGTVLTLVLLVSCSIVVKVCRSLKVYTRRLLNVSAADNSTRIPSLCAVKVETYYVTLTEYLCVRGLLVRLSHFSNWVMGGWCSSISLKTTLREEVSILDQIDIIQLTSNKSEIHKALISLIASLLYLSQ